MDTDRKWIVVRIDGKLAGISRDYGRLADISARIANEYGHSEKTTAAKKTARKKSAPRKEALPYGEVTATAVSFDEVQALKKTVRWEDMMLFGTDFQKQVWKRLWDMASGPAEIRLLSYSDFAQLCQNKAGVRAVAHAVGLNPIPVVIPCHLVVPKESIDKIREIQKKAETTIFKGDDLCLETILQDTSIDFGEYALGKVLKRQLISADIAGTT